MPSGRSRVKKKAVTPPRMADPPPKLRGQVWEARNYTDNQIIGWLVTEEGDIDAPLAFVDYEAEDSLNTALGVARDSSIPFGVAGIIDLGGYGEWTGELPMPGFVYGLLCRPVGENSDTISQGPVCPAPFCQFRLASLVGQFVAKRFSAADRQQYSGGVLIALDGGDDGTIDQEVEMSVPAFIAVRHATPAVKTIGQGVRHATK